jgi:S1-C subfamily serine protease
MKALRPLVWAAVLVTGFLYVTSVAHWDIGRFLRPMQQAGRLWAEPESAQTAGFSNDEQNNIDIYKLARQATVNITSVVYRENWFFQLYPEKGTGSGFIINPEGQILTNYHVIGGNAQLTVTLGDKKSYKAKVLGSDARADLALIRITAPGKLPFLRLGDSEHLMVGQKVLAIGNPFGLEGTLTTGIVSSLGRSLQTDQSRTLEGMIQTDAAINPGNSGGPLLDSHGNVIGINTAIYGSQGSIGIGFAMPIARAKAMLDEFHKNGRITRPSLGITTVFVAGDLAEMLRLPVSGGLLVQRVERGSAAAVAGVRPPQQSVIVGNYSLGVGGDLIIAVEGEAVEGNDSLQKALARKRAGDTLRLTVFRNGRSVQISVTLGEAPQVL